MRLGKEMGGLFMDWWTMATALWNRSARSLENMPMLSDLLQARQHQSGLLKRQLV
jgi:hypothetical protein